MSAEPPSTLDPGGLSRPAPRGRPRDPTLEARVYDAAIAVYASAGWPGFSFDTVAKAAGAGKAALYRRWNTPAALLFETLDARWYQVAEIDTGALREDLQALARMCLDALCGPHAGVMLHLRADAARFAEIQQPAQAYSEKLIHEGRKMVRRAIERGELPASVKPGLIMDIVVGAVTNHVISTPGPLRAAMIEQSERFIHDLIELLLQGLHGLQDMRGRDRPARQAAGPHDSP